MIRLGLCAVLLLLGVQARAEETESVSKPPHVCCVPNAKLCAAMSEAVEALNVAQKIDSHIAACTPVHGEGKDVTGELNIVQATLQDQKIRQDVLLTCSYACDKKDFSDFPPHCKIWNWTCRTMPVSERGTPNLPVK